MLFGILIHFVLTVGFLRFRGSFLEEEHGEDHVEPHLQELALPVLEDRLAEFAGLQKLGVRDLVSAVLPLLFVVDLPSAPTMSNERDEEKKDENDRQAIVSPHADTAFQQ